VRTRTQLIAGAGMLAAGIVLAATVSADGGPDKVTTQGWSDPVPCYTTVEQVLICELGSPVASPIASETPVSVATDVPEQTNVIDTIVALPSTGVGPGR
jgi:hypothetical protein